MTVWNLLRSEFVKLPRSSVLKASIVGLSMGLLNGMLFLMSSQAIHTWQGLDAWHTTWTTFLSPLAIALFAGLTAVRENRARGGGTWWRPAPLRALRAAEFFWLALVVFATNCFVVLSAIPFGFIAHLPGAAPIANLSVLALVLGLTSFAILSIQLKIAHWFGLVASLLVGFVGNLSGVILAEKSHWWLNPWSWPVRATLALTGTHANGIPLGRNNAAWHISYWPIIALSVVVAVPIFFLPDMQNGTSVIGRRAKPEKIATSYRIGALASELVKQRSTIFPWLSIFVPVMFGLLALWRHSPESFWEGWALLVVPFGAALAAAIAWMWERDAWRVLRSHPVSIQRLYFVKISVLVGYLLFSSFILACFSLLLAMPFQTVVLLYLANVSVGFMLLALYLLLAVRLGVGAALGAGMFFTLLAVLFGGSGLGATIWPFFPWVWGWIPPMLGFATPFSILAILLGLALSWLGARASTAIL